VIEQPLEDLLARLDRERREADRAYNDALTAVDRALGTAPRLPAAPPSYDEEKIAAINREWTILPDGAPAIDRSIKGRLRAFVWRLVGPPLGRQQAFNSAVVDHINRNAVAHREAHRALASLIDVLRREFDALVAFESRLVQYLQTITAYVDTKDRIAGGSELRERLALVEQRIAVVRRELERAGDLTPSAAATAPGGNAGFGGTVASATYVGFEDRFRGTQDAIRTRVEDYVALFAGATDVLDVGCGRGELLGLLRDHGIKARGIDVNHAMVELCRARGLDVEKSDAVSYLVRQPDASLGGLSAIQVVEHFEPSYLLRFLDAAYQKLRPGAALVLETINPSCWLAFFDTYIRDPTHERPLHPETLKYLVQAAGFASADIQYRAPVSEGDRLDRVAAADIAAPNAAIAAVVNAHAEKLNARLFSSMDYVVVARR